MAKFKVGDRARVVGKHTEQGDIYIGSVCEVVEIGSFEGVTTGEIHPYKIKLFDGELAAAHDHELEPIIDLGSSPQREESVPLGNWDELQKTINWNPTKEVNHVE